MRRSQKKAPDFKSNKREDCYYDVLDKKDYALIESSFAKDYGIRLDQEKYMSWDAFCNYLSGLGSETPLVTIVSIRSEKDKEKIKNFSPAQKRIYREWRDRQLQNYTQEDEERMKKEMQAMGDAIIKAFT